MELTKLFDLLSYDDQRFVLIYFISGVLFIVFSFLIYYCYYTSKWFRWASALTFFSVGFMLLSTAGKALKGFEYDFIWLTQGMAIVSTIGAFWVAAQFLMWNHRKRKEELEKEKK